MCYALSMTKKDFEAVARAIASEAAHCDHGQKFAVRMVASAIAAEFAQANPRFDRERFMTACGVR